MKIINLTPHPVIILKKDDSGMVGYVGRTTKEEIRVSVALEIPPSGTIANVKSSSQPSDDIIIDGLSIPTVKMTFSDIENLPQPEKDTYYFVSSLVANACKEKGIPTDNLVLPGETVRDENGRIIGILSLSRP